MKCAGDQSDSMQEAKGKVVGARGTVDGEMITIAVAKAEEGTRPAREDTTHSLSSSHIPAGVIPGTPSLSLSTPSKEPPVDIRRLRVTDATRTNKVDTVRGRHLPVVINRVASVRIIVDTIIKSKVAHKDMGIPRIDAIVTTRIVQQVVMVPPPQDHTMIGDETRDVAVIDQDQGSGHCPFPQARVKGAKGKDNPVRRSLLLRTVLVGTAHQIEMRSPSRKPNGLLFALPRLQGKISPPSEQIC